MEHDNSEILELKTKLIEAQDELRRIQRLPHMDKARASAVIMQVAAQLARMPEHAKAKALQNAVDLWSTYTVRIEAKNEKLLGLLEEMYDHTEYCGWGDSHEREPIIANKLPQRVEDAIKDK